MTHTASSYVGRVGALAFALGAGVVIAGGVAAASADTGTDRSSASVASPGPRVSTATQPSRTRAVAPAKTTKTTKTTKTAEQAAAPSAGAQSVGSTIFARRPTLAYNAAQNVQDVDGSISGTLNPNQANGYSLTYSVTGAPAKGSVDIAANGTFIYTPDSDFAALGGTDTFTVLADDRPGNVEHWHGLSTFFAPNGGHTATTAVTVLQNPTDTPIPISVLGNSDQLRAESLATSLQESPLNRVAAEILKAGWLLAASRNYELIGGPDAENLARLDQAVIEYATQAALAVQLLDSMNPTVIQQVAPPHDWYLQDFAGSRIWYDNPDTIYRFIGVNSASSYVISGRFDLSAGKELPADTNFSVLTGLSGITADNLNGRDMVINPDGSFSITASSAPAAPGQANHLQLVPGTTLITTRNTLTDWNTQPPMTLSVLRVSGPPPSLFAQIGGFAIPGLGPLIAGDPLLTALVSLIPPLPTARPVQAIETAIIMLLLGISGENRYMGVATTDPSTGQLRQPNTMSQPDRNAEFLSSQLQSAGYFSLTDDQALVVTVDPGNARYFNLPVTDLWTISSNYWDTPASLNNGQAVANPDGTYTFVISTTDPGVANWVSTDGLNQGTISMRFQDFDQSSEAVPTVSTEVVALTDLGSVLPDTTVYLTPGERAAQIAQRQLGYNLRWAPYPQA
ncbi:MAG: Ig-like domain-containing protein [Mycobacterium sp.]|nr:Ig-like domain-containing protein [Mycobacterium sp.]